MAGYAGLADLVDTGTAHHSRPRGVSRTAFFNGVAITAGVVDHPVA